MFLSSYKSHDIREINSRLYTCKLFRYANLVTNSCGYGEKGQAGHAGMGCKIDAEETLFLEPDENAVA